MTYECPADSLDEIHQLRVQRRYSDVDELAEGIWSSWKRREVTQPRGLGAVCQTAFISALDSQGTDSDRSEKAQLWQARASAASVIAGELNTMAMLLLPLAHQARQVGHRESAIEIMHEVAALVDEFERAEEARFDECQRDGQEFKPSPGVSLQILRRSQHEKLGYLLWRNGDYSAAIEQLDLARDHAPSGTRDHVRVEGGMLLAQLGEQEDQSGIDAPAAARAFAELADAAFEGGWLDVASRLRENAEALEAGRVGTVQELTPIEVE